jgi:hypothetical protein
LLHRSLPNERTQSNHLRSSSAISWELPAQLVNSVTLIESWTRHTTRTTHTAAAALFTNDALFIAPEGMFSVRRDIEAKIAGTFQRSPITEFNCSRDRTHLNAIDNAVWSAGQWFGTFQSQTGPVFAWGYWSAIYVREGDAWKFRMFSLSEHPRPAAGPSSTSTPSSQ